MKRNAAVKQHQKDVRAAQILSESWNLCYLGRAHTSSYSNSYNQGFLDAHLHSIDNQCLANRLHRGTCKGHSPGMLVVAGDMCHAVDDTK